ncbi:Aminopeptidase [Planctomycetes bacterium Pan216]|uniref:Aminopeptidase n=1 Tax=Kolteria novifilia TaxID=2527975 RepID=A0A518B0Q2_9BACT|nr:Aminopeptidase [Planctomycetes bacterium Pan216]
MTSQNVLDIEITRQRLADAGIDGWLFRDFRGTDTIGNSLLGLAKDGHRTRQFFYYIPAQGEPVKIVHRIEPRALEPLPGQTRTFSRWQELDAVLGEVLGGAQRIAMQYSPLGAIPYISRIDAGTVERVRSLGVEIVSSADLVQEFQATLNERQWHLHRTAADKLHRLINLVFSEISHRLDKGHRTTEYDIQRFMLEYYRQEGLVSDYPPIVAVGANSSDPHYMPSEKHHAEIVPDRVVQIDTWAKCNKDDGIYADISWVGYTGAKVPAEVAQVFATIAKARDAGVDAIKTARSKGETLRGCDVDDVCRGIIEEAGHGEHFVHRTGHSLYDVPHGNGANIDNYETHDDRLLRPRCLFTIEPGIYIPEQFGLRTEINVYLPDEGDPIVTGSGAQPEVALLG